MAYELTDIEAALVTIVRAVSGTGKVHDRDRWTNDQKEFKEYFWIPSTKLINGCCIVLGGYLPFRGLSSKMEKRYRMKIWHVFSYSDKQNTANVFQPLMVAVVDAINTNFIYMNAWHVFAPNGDAQMTTIDIRKWAGYLVHYAEIFVTVEVRT